MERQFRMNMGRRTYASSFFPDFDPIWGRRTQTTNLPFLRGLWPHMGIFLRRCLPVKADYNDRWRKDDIKCVSILRLLSSSLLNGQMMLICHHKNYLRMQNIIPNCMFAEGNVVVMCDWYSSCSYTGCLLVSRNSSGHPICGTSASMQYFCCKFVDSCWFSQNCCS